MKTESKRASLALRQAQQREAPGLMADAEIQLGWACERFGDAAAACAAFEAAISGYHAVRNPRGKAAAPAKLTTGPLRGRDCNVP